MSGVTMIVHHEATDDGVCWWAESDDFPGFTAAGSTLEELREMYATEVGDRRVTEVLERESVILTVPGMAPLVVFSTHPSVLFTPQGYPKTHLAYA